MRATTKLVLVGAGLALASCQSRLHISDDFGRAVLQDTIAQVDDPEAKYVGLPEGGAHGRRVGLAQDRYVQGKVIKPASTTTSTVRSQGGGGDGGGGGGGEGSPSQ